MHHWLTMNNNHPSSLTQSVEGNNAPVYCPRAARHVDRMCQESNPNLEPRPVDW